MTRISESEFYEWLFGPEKFSGLSRNVPMEIVFSGPKKFISMELCFVQWPLLVSWAVYKEKSRLAILMSGS